MPDGETPPGIFPLEEDSLPGLSRPTGFQPVERKTSRMPFRLVRLAADESVRLADNMPDLQPLYFFTRTTMAETSSIATAAS